MRDPGTEPLPMISGDVMELHHLIYAERKAHAAEVAGLRTLLQEWNDLAQHQGLSTQAHRNRTAAALAAPPSAAVEAVEGMRKALEAQPCRCSLLLKCPHCAGDVVEGVDQFSGSWICGACVKAVTLPKDPACPCIRCAALAAWKEATRG